MPTDQWIIVNRPLFRTPGALVGLQDRKVLGFILLYDPRDANNDGLSVGERLLSYTPIFGNLVVQADYGAMMREIALDERVLDSDLYREGGQVIVKAAFVAVKEAISAIYLGRIAAAAATVSLAGTSLTGASHFFARQGLQRAFKEMMERATGLN